MICSFISKVEDYILDIYSNALVFWANIWSIHPMFSQLYVLYEKLYCQFIPFTFFLGMTTGRGFKKYQKLRRILEKRQGISEFLCKELHYSTDLNCWWGALLESIPIKNSKCCSSDILNSCRNVTISCSFLWKNWMKLLCAICIFPLALLILIPTERFFLDRSLLHVN